MLRTNTIVAVVLCAATAVAAFGVGRITAPPPALPPPAELGAAMRAALGEGDELRRLGRSASLLEQLDPGTLPQVLAVYDAMLPVLGQWEIRPFVAAWARFDPAGALDHTSGWPFKPKREIGVEAAMEGWALRDPAAARHAFEQLSAERPGLRENLFLGLLAGWVHSGQAGLESYIAALPPATQDTATGIVAGALVRKGGADAALAWADAILRDEALDGGFKRSVFRRATRSVTRIDPERGAAWVLLYAGKEYAEDGPHIVAEQWGSRDGKAALQWVRDHVEGKAREQAAREAFVQWLRADPAAAKAWLASEALTEFDDPALDAYARRLDDRAPEEAVGWCARILDAMRRRGCLRTAARQWYQRDPVAAEAWLQQSELDEEARNDARRPPAARQRARGMPRAAAGVAR
jgi:hypothetical protein